MSDIQVEAIEYLLGDFVRCSGGVHRFFDGPQPTSWCQCGGVVFGEIAAKETLDFVGAKHWRIWKYEEGRRP